MAAQVGARVVSYEVHKFADRRWQIAWITDDRRLAIFDAKRMIARRRYLAVRVVEERYDHAAGGYQATTIFQRSRVSEVPSYAAMQRDRRRDAELYDEPELWSPPWIANMLVIVGAMAIGAAAFAAVQWAKAHAGL